MGPAAGGVFLCFWETVCWSASSRPEVLLQNLKTESPRNRFIFYGIPIDSSLLVRWLFVFCRASAGFSIFYS